MDIFPQDLGRRRYILLIQRRALTPTFWANPVPPKGRLPALPPPYLGALGRFWIRRLDIKPEDAACTLPALGNRHILDLSTVFGFLLSLPILCLGAFGMDFGLAALGGCLIFLGAGLTFWPRRTVESLHRRPVTEGDLEALQSGLNDDLLEAAYLRLAREMAAQNVTNNSAKSLRDALRALGEAIDALPYVPAADADAQTLRADADRARAEAGREPDAVAAASLRRRADALDRSARAASQSEALRRRAAVLRDELLAQTESLRLGLAAARPDSGEVAGLAALAESVRAVADEAAGVAAARAELDAALSPPVIISSEGTPAVQSVGLRS